ncbi:MYND-type domain-containing protein [Mycena indigotica]|uniref:MYND-type domain-containing protein n=1 Tax=Mycena indigotica TaxID=2126181 RepID=A0A8H6W422_9AGAR|nr:MYND-type domain-containing protein [Mycena indigotica]KAF7304172.1 MYND-type domain-containing protein [Mycena indigotica]
MTPRQPYPGTDRKLVLGFDIGTTYAGISYSFLQPGLPPTILPVTRFPPQEHVGSDSKVRSLVYYDSGGRPMACGAMAVQEQVEEKAEEQNWHKAEWFKLHMRPDHIVSTSIDILPPLPENTHGSDVYADFLHYLYGCAQSYLIDTYHEGEALWVELQHTAECAKQQLLQDSSQTTLLDMIGFILSLKEKQVCIFAS